MKKSPNKMDAGGSADNGDDPEIEQDVNVCDICGDAGREDLLAICSKCADGAEHTYCMRVMMVKLPESDWLCEECRTAESTEKPAEPIDDAEGVENSKSTELSGSTVMDTQDSDLEVNKFNDVVAQTASKEDENSDADAVNRVLPEVIGPSVQRNAIITTEPPSVKCSVNRRTPCARQPSLTRPVIDAPSTSTHQSPKRMLLKSNSFDVTHHPKAASCDKGRAIGKSASFKSRLSMSERKVKFLSPDDLQVPNLRGAGGFRPVAGEVKTNSSSVTAELNHIARLPASSADDEPSLTGEPVIVSGPDTPPLATDNGSIVSPTEEQGKGSKLRAAIEAAMLKKPGLCRKPNPSLPSPTENSTGPVADESAVIIIPEHNCIWQGGFEVHKKNSEPPDLCGGIQAHLSSHASSRVADVVSRFSSRVPLSEVPRLAAWPSQFHASGSADNCHIALYFFARDSDSYDHHYKSLLDTMIRDDLALTGRFDDFDLLIFPSNQLPENSQRWNMLFFLWGLFKGKRPVVSDAPPAVMSSAGAVSLRSTDEPSLLVSSGDVVAASTTPAEAEAACGLLEVDLNESSNDWDLGGSMVGVDGLRDEDHGGSKRLRVGGCEMRFFPLDSGVVEDRCEAAVAACAEADRLLLPDLELALGGGERSGRRSPFSSSVQKGGVKQEEDDASASLSLSLSFPFGLKEEATRSGNNSSLFLFGGALLNR